MESRIVYFEEGGAQNTQATLDLVSERLGSKDIKKIVLASTTGDTARRAMEFFSGSGSDSGGCAPSVRFSPG